ncbi:MAG: hypothetical protein E7311_04245 [Clostridiales bacterium]|nr:hypothetical protein [Clostridiales bacterium]
MKNLKNSKTSGISLVALIVTIIVLIILTAAVIVTFMEGGIIEKAKEAVFKSDIRTYQEILAVKNAENMINLATGNGEGTQLNSTEVKDIIPEFKEEYAGMIAISNGEIVLGEESKEPYATWLADLGIGVAKTSVVALLEVGDYVDYMPTGETYEFTTEGDNKDIAWIWNEENGTSKNTYEPGEEVVEVLEEAIKWRVLKNDGKSVTLVSADPVESIYLYGEKGFINGPSVIDEICATVYGGRNLKIEDVNELIKGDKAWGDNETNWMYVGTDGEKYNVPEGVKTIAELETSGATGVGTISNTYLPESGTEVGDYAPNYYNYDKPTETEDNKVALDIVFRSKGYWLSSSCVRVNFNSDRTFFDMRVVRSSGKVYVIDLYIPNEKPWYGTYRSSPSSYTNF